MRPSAGVHARMPSGRGFYHDYTSSTTIPRMGDLQTRRIYLKCKMVTCLTPPSEFILRILESCRDYCGNLQQSKKFQGI